jgi:hypothetical protein
MMPRDPARARHAQPTDTGANGPTGPAHTAFDEVHAEALPPRRHAPGRVEEKQLPGGILVATVLHRRLRPRVNAFAYKVNYLCVALSDIDRLDGRWLGVDRAAPVSFHRRDHGDGGDLDLWMRDRLREWRLDTVCAGRIMLITLPRQLGYVFNPVSFWCCHDTAGRLRAVLCEVSNTFGERHNYVVCHDDARPIAPDDWIEGRKVFHVSPFLPVSGRYRFRFALDDGHAAVTVHYHDGDGLVLATSIAGRRESLCDRSVACRFLARPLMTLAVICRIHWQALRLWLKRTRFFSRPAPPGETTTR